ncbi:tRNA glutamyl-Q(34) synthetase GluQRS [Symbiobacterium thermophilum]|uniref:Glutamyl-Q tRNA(Asp) synthetase n=1 Tax=Symbiobacterium thermophilum TaxID=2734 RepID=A0A953LFH7_SYMTR|nr:tRNA glutamyl-Q(34) synthetase GluQRS [Symbiobacterium thermophilum]MBY6275228.1 tRNA glutamyl-Q(34) synthetase GluQRS [Symbiobacterium thermophilum]
MLCGRFAPTPSGALHLGNARTALLAWLHARRAGGRFILRIEDIDRARSRPHLAEQAIADLRWLGLDWDEGPDVGGPHGPYCQSEREELYRDALARLQAEGRLYPCYCSRAQLMAIASAPHGLASEGPAYPGTCRRLTPEERRAREAGGKTPSLRFALPDEEIAFTDLIAGPQRFPPGAGGDFVVLRADGVIGYQLAVVVDDALMGVTHVLRGGDLLDSTPRQILLYRALGWPVPAFGHLPLLLGPDGARLAKRHGAVTLAGIRAAGTPPETVVGHLAYLSGLVDRPEPVRPEELIPVFDLARIPREPVRIPAETIAALSGGTA